jgi:Big-like domain-containing protein
VSPSLATGTVQFFDGASSLGSSAVSAGSASLATSALSVGSHSITAVYSGDSSYATSTSSVLTQTVNGGGTIVGTTTLLTSSPSPSNYGQTITFTATVTPASGTSTPTGGVTFMDGSTILGSSTLNASGIATLLVPGLAVGSHSITAQYSGDTSFAGSTSTVLTQVVNLAPTTTTLTSSRNPSNPGQRVTFTATVSAAAATGVVQFFDGLTLLGSANLSGGSASLSTSNLSTGTHSITAQYGGDGNYNGSSSAVLTQTVGRKK